MNKKRVISYVLGAAILTTSVTPVIASEVTNEIVEVVEKDVLTVDQAVKKAIDASRSLEASSRNTEVQRRLMDLSLSAGDYAGYKNVKMLQDYADKTDELAKEIIEYEVNKMFDKIIMLEKEIELNEQKIILQEQELTKYEIMHQHGLMTDLQIDGAKLILIQLKDEQIALENSLANTYSELNQLMGVSNREEYVIEKELVEYKPYGYEGDVETLARRRADNSIMVWLTRETANNTKYSLGGNSYIEYLQSKNAQSDAEDGVKDAEEAIKTTVREMYAALLQLEDQHNLLVQTLEIKEKEIQVKQVQLENGLISQLEYDKAVYDYEEAQLNLQKLVNEHSYLKKQLNNPELVIPLPTISMSS